jgi:hypothetical protein
MAIPGSTHAGSFVNQKSPLRLSVGKIKRKKKGFKIEDGLSVFFI